MCLSFDYAAGIQAAHDFAATKAALRAAHAVDCNRIQVTILMHRNGSHSSLCYMPMSSPTAVLAMFPCERDCLGDGAKYLVPCGSIPCNAGNLEAWFEPGKFVPIPEEDEDDHPSYRSTSIGSTATVPVIKLPPSKCIKNLNDSCTFVLKTADHVMTDAELDKAIEGGTYADKATYLLTLGDACFKSLVASMNTNAVDQSKVFALSEDGEVDPYSKVNFLNELYPNMRANHDMLVCIPGPDKDGNLKMEAAFSFCFHYPETHRRYPLPGLVHNVDHSTVSPEQAVEGDYYITSNINIPMTIDNEAVDAAYVGLCHSNEFLPRYKVHRSLPATDHDYQYHDYDAWITGCKALQSKAEKAYWESISNVCYTMGLPEFDQENFYSTNLIGRSLAKNATSVVCGNELPCLLAGRC